MLGHEGLGTPHNALASAGAPAAKLFSRSSSPHGVAESVLAIVITGMPGSGKGEFVRVCEERGVHIVHMGDVVREEARQRGLELTDQNVGGLAQRERELHGYDIWAVRTIPHLRDGFSVIEGCRGDAEVRCFRSNLGRALIVVAIHARPRLRYERLVRRGRTDSPATQAEFESRDLRELGWGIGNVISTADELLINEGSLEEFHRAARSLLDRLVGAQR